MGLRGKKILITAGPTWVPVDEVRVISNIASGSTGKLIAGYARAHGAKVTLLLGPIGICNLKKSIRIVRFCFFDELRRLLRRELENNKYDIIVHSAAVSDFGSGCKSKGKLNSDRVQSLRLVPLKKLIIQIRRFARDAKLVMFKLELAVTNKTLIQRARRAKDTVGADFIVANRLKPYQAFIINKQDNQIFAHSRQDLAKKLINILADS